VAWAAERSSFIAGKALADKYGWTIGKSISIKGDIYPFDLTNITLRGIFTLPNRESRKSRSSSTASTSRRPSATAA
jgi:hypothetical protein